MERAIEVTLNFVKERKAFGQRVLDFQNTQFKLAECKTKARVARTFVDNCVLWHLEGSSMRKRPPWPSTGVPIRSAKSSMSAFNFMAARAT